MYRTDDVGNKGWYYMKKYSVNNFPESKRNVYLIIIFFFKVFPHYKVGAILKSPCPYLDSANKKNCHTFLRN